METLHLELAVPAFLLLSLLASMRATFCAKARAFKAWREARTDYATGIGNKRGWSERTDFLQSLSRRFSFVLFDVANLKAMNQALGHEEADRVLYEFAQSVRYGDMKGNRIGGDEFAIAIPGGTLADANTLRDRIEEKLGAIVVAPGAVVFIVGAAGVWEDGDDLSELMTIADFELERRKAAKKEALGVPLTRSETLANLGG